MYVRKHVSIYVPYFVGSFEVPECKENLVFILGFVLESRTLLPESGVALGEDRQSDVAWKAGVFTSKILSQPLAMYSLRKLGLAGRRPVAPLAGHITTAPVRS
jgi:hypothetical protein